MARLEDMEKIRRYVDQIFLVSLAVIAAVIWHAVFYFEARQNLLITFFDVSQGDATLTSVTQYTKPSPSECRSLI